MLVRKVQAIKNYSNYFKNNSKPTNYSYASRPLEYDTVSFTGFFSQPTYDKKTNYRALNKETGYMTDLVMKPHIDFDNYGTEDKLFPRMISRYSNGSYGNFRNVYMKNSDFANSTFIKTDFSNAKIHNSDLSNCDFTNAIARNARFANSNFANSTCRGTNFSYANLQEANFENADLQNSNLSFANVIGTDFSRTKNLPQKMANAVYNKTTKFPAGFSPEYAFMRELKSGGDLHGVHLNSMHLKSSDEVDFDEYTNLDLASSNLDKSYFKQLDMKESTFDNSSMKKVVFDFCVLNNSSFKNVDLERACFKNSDLGESEFYGPKTNLQYVNFIGTNLAGTDIKSLGADQLRNALFSPSTILPEDMTIEDAKARGMIYVVNEVDFTDKNLYGMNFKNFKFSEYGINDFQGASFKRANLHHTNFEDTKLTGCSFDKASLKYSSLENADCENASFEGANMICTNIKGCNLKNANLCGANLKGTIMNEKTNFANARYDENTIFPEGFNPIKYNMKLTPNTQGALV